MPVWTLRPILLLLLFSAPYTVGGDLPRVVCHDNQHPAGKLRGQRLALQLEIVEGDWHPDGDDGPGLRVPVFAEAGHAPSDPGPLVRVAEGTTVEVTIRNRVAGTSATVHGFHSRPGKDEPLVIPAGEERQVRFIAGASGTFFYWASLTGKALDERENTEGQLSGALIIDPRGQKSDRDSIFLITYYFRDGDPKAQPPLPAVETWAVNGRSWPHTRRYTYRVGEPIHWRWINASYEPHPLHLHGTYFSIDALSDGEQETVFAPADRRLVVTENLIHGRAMRITWSPEHAGNWLFHCHILYHVAPELDLATQLAPPAAAHVHGAGERHMAGLVVGVTAVPGPLEKAQRKEASPARKLTLVVGERGFKLHDLPALGYQVIEGDVDPATLKPQVTAPGPPIILTRGEPVEVRIVNRLSSSTAVHWHGIQLESYYDGVPGFGGDSRQVTPPIPPGGSFIARFTPPRSGTFIYHTHMNDLAQIATGLYGALIVAERREAFDPDTDKVFVFSRGGPDDENDPVLINGVPDLPPVVLRAGQRYRLRFIGILPAPAPIVTLSSAGAAVDWLPLAKDGADLPASLRVAQPAKVRVFPGETYDFEFQPAKPGEIRLEATLPRWKKTAYARFDVR